MKTRMILICVAGLLSVSGANAQNAYRLLIEQVFPNKKEVYYNAFDYRRELDDAITRQSSRLRGNECNYIMKISTPAGMSTRYIQNINWIQTVNGTKSYHKSRTSPLKEYPVATVWTGSACNPSGHPTGEETVYEYLYRVMEGDDTAYRTEFILKDDACRIGKSLYDSIYTEKALVQVHIQYMSNGSMVTCMSLSNQEEHERYLRRQEQEKQRRALQDNIEKFIEGTDALEKNDSIDLKTFLENSLKLIEESTSSINDSVFKKKSLDVLYLKMLRNHLTQLKKRDIKKIQGSYDFIMNAAQKDVPRDTLKQRTDQIKQKLFPQDNK